MAEKDVLTNVSIHSGDGKEVWSGTGEEFDSAITRALGTYPVRIPLEDEFVGRKFLPADELERIGKELIEKYASDFAHLEDAKIVYLWKDKGGEVGGRITLGKCVRPTGLAEFFANETTPGAFDTVDYVIWAAADHLRKAGARERTLHALVFHELLHTREEDGKLIVVGHEFEGFAREIEEFGMWTESVRKIAQACDTVKDVQQGLFAAKKA